MVQSAPANNSKNVLVTWLFWGILIFGALYFGKMGWDYFHPSVGTVMEEKRVAAVVPDAPLTVPAGMHRVFSEGHYINVPECTAVTDECGSMELGKPADYGTGTHVSADGRVRPNPPAGWEWSGK